MKGVGLLICEPENGAKSVMKRSQLEENTVVELLDRVLDNGIVVEPSARVYLIGHELSASKGHMVVEWIRTHV